MGYSERFEGILIYHHAALAKSFIERHAHFVVRITPIYATNPSRVITKVLILLINRLHSIRVLSRLVNPCLQLVLELCILDLKKSDFFLELLL